MKQNGVNFVPCKYGWYSFKNVRGWFVRRDDHCNEFFGPSKSSRDTSIFNPEVDSAQPVKFDGQIP